MSQWFSLALFLYSSLSSVVAHSQTPKNVILVLLDGVRWEEFYNGIDGKMDPAHSGEQIFQTMNPLRDPHALVLGPKSECQTIHTSNWVTMSLPGYQSIFGGRTPWCFSNDCGRAGPPTLFETFIQRRFLESSIALFASWKKIDLAAISSAGLKLGLTHWTHNIGMQAFDHPEHKKTNQLQFQDLPQWNDARKDVYTFEHAKLYLEREKPRLLTIQLVDSDEWGHLNHYPNYIKTLKQYDLWIADLIQTLGVMGEYGKNTMIIVSTDHGRGPDPSNWSDHGYQKGGKKVWLWTHGYTRAPQDCLIPWTHSRIRRFIESILRKTSRT
ncbi:MAG: alkaline phosphatase family protein [Xanthomonadaceae bacterium]|nr:alkaline phosphatase family protein [Xanthomonadaceae bacterium]